MQKAVILRSHTTVAPFQGDRIPYHVSFTLFYDFIIQFEFNNKYIMFPL
jgi:hypothetical protein